MNENRKTQPQLWRKFQWLGMLVLAVCLLWCNAARVKAEDIVIQCGDNCYGTLTDTGVLTISGTGAMWDYTDVGNSVFKKYGDNIYKVVIQDGITRIGDHVFGSYSKSYSGEFTKIQSVTIGKGVQEIGDSAFDWYGWNVFNRYSGKCPYNWERSILGLCGTKCYVTSRIENNRRRCI